MRLTRSVKRSPDALDDRVVGEARVTDPVAGGAVPAQVAAPDDAYVVELEALGGVDAADLVQAVRVRAAQKFEGGMPAARRPASGLAFQGICPCADFDIGDEACRRARGLTRASRSRRPAGRNATPPLPFDGSARRAARPSDIRKSNVVVIRSHDLGVRSRSPSVPVDRLHECASEPFERNWVSSSKSRTSGRCASGRFSDEIGATDLVGADDLVVVDEEDGRLGCESMMLVDLGSSFAPSLRGEAVDAGRRASDGLRRGSRRRLRFGRDLAERLKYLNCDCPARLPTTRRRFSLNAFLPVACMSVEAALRSSPTRLTAMIDLPVPGPPWTTTTDFFASAVAVARRC